MCWYGECSCLRQPKQPFILDRISWRTGRFTTNIDEILNLFNITQILILEHSEEIVKVNTIDSASPSWKRSVLSHDQVIQWTKARVPVRSDSVLCLGKMNESKDAITRWEGQVEGFKNVSLENCWRSSWIRVEYFPRIYVIADSSEDPGWLARQNIERGKIHRSDHLHVNVQRHRLEKERKWWNLYFEFRKSQGVREEMLARTLDISGSWRRKGVVWNSSLHTWRKMRFYSQSNGWKQFKRLQVHPVFRSIGAFSCEILKKKNGRDTMHFNTDAWAIRPDGGRKGTRKTERIRDQRCINMCEITRSKTIGILSKQVSGTSLRENNQDFESLTETIRFTRVCELASFRTSISWYELQNSTWRGRRFWADHSILQRIHTFTSTPTIQNFCSTSWRNNYWTSHWSSDRENHRPLWIWNCSSITQRQGTDILCNDISRGKSRFVDEVHISQCRTQIQCRLTHWTSESRRRKILLGTVED